MIRSCLAVSLVVMFTRVAVVAAPQGTQAVPPAGGTRHIYITALDKKGVPVTGLTDKDVTVREDRVAREVIAVQRATAPLEIALLVDDSGPGLRFIRESVGAFIQRLAGLAEMAIVSTGGRNSMLVDYTHSVDALLCVLTQGAPAPSSRA